MASPIEPPRRVSMAYILGFSDKPYKDPKPMNPYVDMMTRPGAKFEWAASDGRKGTLTGKGKSRLTAANLSKVPSKPGPVKEVAAAKPASKKAESKKASSRKSESKKDADEDTGGMLGIFGEEQAPADTGSGSKKENGDGDANRTDNPHGFTKEQDDKIMQMKNENPGVSWVEVETEIGKDKNLCKTRFNKIKPAGWKPTSVQKKGRGGEKQNKGNKNQKQEKQEEDKTEEAAGNDTAAGWGGDGGGNENSWDKINNDEADGFNNTWEDNCAGASGGNGNSWNPNNNNGGGGGGENGWGTGDAPAGGNDGGWNNGDNTGGDGWGFGADNNGGFETGGGDWNADVNDNKSHKTSNSKKSKKSDNADAWNTGGDSWGAIANNSNSKPTSKAPSKAASVKPPSNSRSKKDQGFVQGSANTSSTKCEFEIQPDETFSAEDLRLIARILQQDYSLVWSRISWRFRDKTGRMLHPEVFEKKITGSVEKGSSKG